MKHTRELFLMLVIGILIGTSLVMLWTRGGWSRGSASDASTRAEVATDASNPSPSESLSSSSLNFPLPPSIPDNTRIGLSVPDQLHGKTVSVGNLAVVGTKWVAVYDEQKGKPGWILGARRVHEGDTETTVELLRPEGTKAGESYFVAILKDDGDDSFNRLTDLPPLSPDKVIVVRFSAK